MGLAFEPNIEMRMFNPLAGARGSALGRLFNSVSDFDRVQQRMHNKLFIADNVMVVTGGRNLGDAYFGIAQSSNFIDLDVLAAGPVVRDLSASFDSYWNDERAYPVQSLVSQAELREIRERTVAADVERRADAPRVAAGDAGAVPARQEPSGGAPKLPDGEPRPSDAGPTDAQFAAAWDQQPMDLASATFTWAPAIVLADRPGKIAADSGGGGDSAAPPPAESPSTSGGGTARASTDGKAAAGAASTPDGAGVTVVDGLLQLIGQARRDLLVISPYFVPGPDMKAAFSAARARGVRVRVLTNSLASNDAPIAHVGYARHREALQQAGRARQRAGLVGRRRRRERRRRIARHAALQGAGARRPAVRHRLDEPRPAIAAAEHRDRPADPQRRPVDPRRRPRRHGAARGCLARRARAGRPARLARPPRQRPARRAYRARHERRPAPAAQGLRPAGARRTAVAHSRGPAQRPATGERQATSRVTVWMSSPTRPPTSVPLMRMN
jgi:phosphatidylserine/phosphatidylglycerophosphate/cardiolipin synthase-like enzyme